jgi:hypothetical protein
MTRKGPVRRSLTLPSRVAHLWRRTKPKGVSQGSVNNLDRFFHHRGRTEPMEINPKFPSLGEERVKET